MMDIRSEDFGKVLLFATMTLDKKLIGESETQLKDLQRIAEKYKGDLAVHC